MADVVHVSAPDLTQAAATVAQHLDTAATPPRSLAPPPMAATPVDVAAAGAAGAIRAKTAALSTQLAPKGPEIQQTGAAAAASLLAQDATNAARLPSVPSVPTPTKPRINALDNRTFKQAPNPPPPGPPGNPFAGWTEAQKQGIAADIAHGHSLTGHPNDFPPEWTEADKTRWIYDTMNDPTTRVGTSTKTGATALLRDGRVIFINPENTDFGTVFRPEPRVQDPWRTPDEYFTQQTKPLEPLPPPTGGPARFPPLTPEEIAPPTTGPHPPAAPHPAAPPDEAPPVKAPVRPPIEEGPMAGGPGPFGPQVIAPPHAHQHWPSESNLEEWGEGPAATK
jgi:hypothetical protein